MKKRENLLLVGRKKYATYKHKKIDHSLKVNLEHSWLLPFLVAIDNLTWNRWEYWVELNMYPDKLPDLPIPAIFFEPESKANNGTRKMLEASLRCISNSQNYSEKDLEYFLDWLLFGFGDPNFLNLPKEPPGAKGASSRLYQVFQLDSMLLFPRDYFGDILSEMKYGKSLGFFPRPEDVINVKTRLLFGLDLNKDLRNKDLRNFTIVDCQMGTGRTLLNSSNYTLQLFGQDINPLFCKCALVNAYIMAPWLARPIWWMTDIPTISCGDTLVVGSERLVNAIGAKGWSQFFTFIENKSKQQQIQALESLGILKQDAFDELSLQQILNLQKYGGVRQ